MKVFKKIGNIIVNILFVLFFLIALFSLYSSITLKKNGGESVNLFGHELRVVISPSMEKCDQTDVSNYKIKDIKTKSLIVVEKVPENEEQAKQFYENIEIGDVLTFKYVYTNQVTITHRVVGKNSIGDGNFIFTLEGDNKDESSGVLQQVINTGVESPNYIIGKVKYVNYPLGVIIYGFKTPVGIICFVIIPCSLVVIYEIIKIVNVINKDKNRKNKEIEEEKNKEIEELRKRIEEMEKDKN